MTKDEIKSLIEHYEFKYNIPMGFLEAVISIESNFKVNALGAAQEIGLAQLLPGGAIAEWEKHYAPLDYWRPDHNLNVAAWYLGERIPKYLKHYNHDDTIKNRVICYNAGIGNLNKGVFPQTTRNYLAKVENYMKQFGKAGAVSVVSGAPAWVPGVIAALGAIGYIVTRK